MIVLVYYVLLYVIFRLGENKQIFYLFGQIYGRRKPTDVIYGKKKHSTTAFRRVVPKHNPFYLTASKTKEICLF